MSSMASAHASTRGARRTIRARRRPRGDCSGSGSPTSTAPRTVSPFRFYFCQREAVETFIYLTEIEPVRKLKDLLEFAEHGMTIQPGEPKRQRLAIKMATGSGKTMAMSLCVVWSYFHALYETGVADDDVVPGDRAEPDRVRAAEEPTSATRRRFAATR